MQRFLRLAAAAAVALPFVANAAVHYVRPGATGTGNGSSWTNAYPKLPSTLVRGDTYYLGPGNYGSHVFQDANSGTSTITLIRATNFNHGAATDWNTTWNSGAAVFSNWQIYTDYYVFNGQRRNSDWQLGTTSNYGIRVAGAGPVRLDNGMGTGADHVTFRFVDFQGGGRDTGNGDDVIYGLSGNSYLTFQYCALHDSDRTIFLMRGNWTNVTVDHSYIARNTSTPATHGEMVSMTDTTNITFSNNVMEDIEGTAFIAGMNGGLAQHWRIFGNTVTHTATYRADTGRKAGHNFGVSGFVYIANDSSNNNVGNDIQMYNNTLVNIQGTWSGMVVQKGSGNISRNNVWYASVRTNNSFGTGAVISHNWYYNTLADGDSSTSKTVCTANCSIFKDLANRNFRLNASTPAGYTLGAPYTVDQAGVTRGITGNWDRGAFQYSGSALSTSAAPKSLIAQ